jgi:hypothetical protein
MPIQCQIQILQTSIGSPGEYLFREPSDKPTPTPHVHPRSGITNDISKRILGLSLKSTSKPGVTNAEESEKDEKRCSYDSKGKPSCEVNINQEHGQIDASVGSLAEIVPERLLTPEYDEDFLNMAIGDCIKRTFNIAPRITPRLVPVSGSAGAGLLRFTYTKKSGGIGQYAAFTYRTFSKALLTQYSKTTNPSAVLVGFETIGKVFLTDEIRLSGKIITNIPSTHNYVASDIGEDSDNSNEHPLNAIVGKAIATQIHESGNNIAIWSGKGKKAAGKRDTDTGQYFEDCVAAEYTRRNSQ